MNRITLSLALGGASVSLCLFIFIYLIKRFSEKVIPSIGYFYIHIVSIMFYNFFYFAMANAGSFFFAKLSFYFLNISITVQTASWLIFCFYYCSTKKNYRLLIRNMVLITAVLTLLVILTNEKSSLYFSEFLWRANSFPFFYSKPGIAYKFALRINMIYGIIVMAIYIRGYMNSLSVHRFRYAAIFLSTLCQCIGLHYGLFSPAFDTVYYLNIFILIMNAICLYGIVCCKMLDCVPISTEVLYEQSDEALLLFDTNGQAIDINRLFKDIYPRTYIDEVTLDKFIDAHPEFKNIKERDMIQYPLTVNGKEKYFCASLRDIRADGRFKIGALMRVKDITVYIENYKKLETIANEALSKAETNEISFLQAQIKPHFLNNTLSVIAATIKSEPDTARELVCDLSDYLRECCFFDDSTYLVPLCQEIETIKTFIKIQKARFGNRFSFEIHMNEPTDALIPRLILQPLVENALKHGVLKKAGGGKVLLSIKTDRPGLFFEIKDDGVGIPREEIPALLLCEDKKLGVGIANINRRLLKFCGKGLVIESDTGRGTTVSFSLPNNLEPGSGA